MSIVSYKLINIDVIDIVNGNLLYNNEKFYVQTPVMGSSEIINHDGEYYIQFNFIDTPTHNLFLSILKNIEKKIIETNESFDTFFLRDIHNNISLRVHIDSVSNTFFNKEKRNILVTEILNKSKCIALIYMNSLHEWKLYQYMKL
jgi:hypothetical protein